MPKVTEDMLVNFDLFLKACEVLARREQKDWAKAIPVGTRCADRTRPTYSISEQPMDE